MILSNPADRAAATVPSPPSATREHDRLQLRQDVHQAGRERLGNLGRRQGALNLSGASATRVARPLSVIKFPTGGGFQFGFRGSWRELSASVGNLTPG